MSKLTQEQREEVAYRSRIATDNAKKVLRSGDRLRVSKCPGTKRWITFSHWDGNWIVSKSGINDFAAMCVDRVNDRPVDFSKGQPE